MENYYEFLLDYSLGLKESQDNIINARHFSGGIDERTDMVRTELIMQGYTIIDNVYPDYVPPVSKRDRVVRTQNDNGEDIIWGIALGGIFF